MAFAGWHSTITDLKGNVVPKAQVTVRDEVTGALAILYTDREGMTGRGNPFWADDQGFAAFHVVGGAYRIIAKSGVYEREWRYVGIGTAQEMDADGMANLLQAGVVPFRSKADLLAFIPDENTNVGGAVWADPVGSNNGYYIWSGSLWSFARALPDTFGRLYVTGGTVNAVQTTLDTGINPASPTVFFIDVLAPNTAAVTLTINGANQGEVLNAAGHSLAAGEWQGRIFFTREAEGHYRIVNDPASALSAAQSATAADLSREASATNANKTGLDLIATGQDRAATKADRIATGQDKTATGADKVQTGQDRIATNAAKESAGQSAVSAAINENKTSEDALATAADRVATGQNKTASATSAGTATAQADRATTEANRAEAAANSIDMPVTYNAQTPTPSQQAQARQNIAADQTNITTVGAALAAPAPKTIIADGDKFGGILSGGAVLATWSWATVKASIKQFTDTLYATVAQGAKADSAVQPAAMNTALDAKQDKLNYTPVDQSGGTMAADPTLPLGVATKQYVDASGGGGWPDGASVFPVSRTINTSYQNTFNHPIGISMMIKNPSNANPLNFQVSANGTSWDNVYSSAVEAYLGFVFYIIPAGYYWRVNVGTAGSPSISSCVELR